MSCERGLNLNQWKNSTPMLIMACLQICRELLSLATFLRVHSNSEEVSYLSWQNTYPNLKTTCHIKLKFFLWTKLLENLLLAKYVISAAAPLIAHNLLINYLNLRKVFFFSLYFLEYFVFLHLRIKSNGLSFGKNVLLHFLPQIWLFSISSW